LTNAERQRAYRRRKQGHKRRKVYFRSESVEWETPRELFEELDREFHFTLDMAATAENAKCERFFTREQDGLAQEWRGVCWMNPPYGPQLYAWIQKAYESSLTGATVVCLIPARVDTRWWHDYVKPFAEVRFIRGRLRFGGSENSAPFASVVVVFRPPIRATATLRQSCQDDYCESILRLLSEH